MDIIVKRLFYFLQILLVTVVTLHQCESDFIRLASSSKYIRLIIIRLLRFYLHSNIKGHRYFQSKIVQSDYNKQTSQRRYRSNIYSFSSKQHKFNPLYKCKYLKFITQTLK